jgi:hypothetical protein
VLEPNALRLMLRTRPPDIRILELIHKIFVHTPADILHTRPHPQDDRVVKVRALASPLGVDAEEVEVLPQPRKQQVEV